MKKIFMIAAAVAGLLAAASCQKEKFGADGSEGVVSLSVEVPNSLQTKAISKAENADIVYYEVWNSTLTKKLYPAADELASAALAVVDGKKQALIELDLITDQTYNFIFWAQNETYGAYSWDKTADGLGLQEVKVNYNVIAADGNNDVYDAYYAVKKIAVTGSIKETITLYRPFAQLNFGAKTMESLFGDVNVQKSVITVSGLATTFNTVAGVGQNISDTSVAFEADGVISETLTVNGEDYTWITMDYMLMNDVQSMVEVSASFELGMEAPVQHSIANVPLKKNYRTNIVGELFIAGADLTVVVDPAFQKPDEDITVGVAEEPEFDGQTYSIKTAGNVLWLAAQPKNFAAGKTISFDADIDMMGQGINPINASSASVNGTSVLGNNHTVSNFVVRATGKNSAGLFGDHKGNITDLNVKNVTVNGEYKAGALAGYVYGNVTGCSAKNVTVTSVPYATNGSFDGGNHVGALVGYAAENSKGIYSYTGNIVEDAVVTGYRDLGGFIGTLQYGVEVYKNHIRNVTVLVDQVTNYYGDKAANAGEVAGRLSADSKFIAPHDNIVENVNLYIPEWTTVEGVLTMELPGNITLFDGQVLCDNRDLDQPYVVDGNGSTVYFKADDSNDVAYGTNTFFSTSDGSEVKVKDITFKGDFNAISLGHYYDSKSNNFNTVLENVNAINCKTASYSQNIAPAFSCYGTVEFNNCNIYGTELSSYDQASYVPYDVAAVNNSNITFNGGKYGKVYLWAQLYAYVNADTEIDWIDCCTSQRTSNQQKYHLTVKDGAKVNTINMRKQYDVTSATTGRMATLVVEAGASVDTLIITDYFGEFSGMQIADDTVGKVILHGTEMTLAEFKAAYNL